MKPKLLKYGGNGVDVKLRSAPRAPAPEWGDSGSSYQDPPADTVFWSPQKWRKSSREGYPDEPAGGFNSFCCVADPERGQWLTEDGTRVALISINGIGEIRWTVDSYSSHYAEGADRHFNLTPVKR